MKEKTRDCIVVRREERAHREGPLCPHVADFSLNAAVRVPAFARKQLERLCRYAAAAVDREEPVIPSIRRGPSRYQFPYDG